MPAFPRRVLGLAVLAGAWVVRQPLWLVQSFIWMVGMFVAFLAWGGMRALTNLLAAYMVAGMWSVGLNIIAQHVGWDRVGKYYEMFVASSITLPQYLCGVVLSALPFASLSVLPAALLLVYGRAASLPYSDDSLFFTRVMISFSISSSVFPVVSMPSSLASSLTPFSRFAGATSCT